MRLIKKNPLKGNLKSRMRDKVRGKIHILPNLVTASNLIMGVYAILLALFTLSSGDFSQKRMSQAAMYVFYGMIFDVFDGFVARLTKTSSHFGMELDSLADLVSFGVAPTVLTYVFILKDAPEPFRKIGVFCCMIYTCCAALRLARFNAQIEDEGKTFSGIPTPEAAGVIISYLLLVGHGYLNPEVSYFDRLLQHYVMPIAPMVLGLLSCHHAFSCAGQTDCLEAPCLCLPGFGGHFTDGFATLSGNCFACHVCGLSFLRTHKLAGAFLSSQKAS